MRADLVTWSNTAELTFNVHCFEALTKRGEGMTFFVLTNNDCTAIFPAHLLAIDDSEQFRMEKSLSNFTQFKQIMQLMIG